MFGLVVPVEVAVDGGAGHAEEVGDLLHGLLSGVVELLGEFGLQDKATRNPVYKRWTDAAVAHKIDGMLYWILSDVQDDGTLYPD